MRHTLGSVSRLDSPSLFQALPKLQVPFSEALVPRVMTSLYPVSRQWTCRVLDSRSKCLQINWLKVVT